MVCQARNDSRKKRIKMGLNEVREICNRIISRCSRKGLIKMIYDLKNIIEDLVTEIAEHKEQVQKLKDEINRLKGEKGKPNIKPNNKVSDEIKEKENNHKDKKPWKKKKKKKKITITRTVRLNVQKDDLPQDAQYKGVRNVVIQDVTINLDNSVFEIERYYSKTERKTYEAKLPERYQGSEFGPGIRSLILLLHYQGRMPQKLLHNMLGNMGVIISEGEIWEILHKEGELFQEEMERARIAAIEKQQFQHIDDTGARIKGANGYTIATGNTYFTFYETGLKKDRLSALRALCGGKDLVFLIDDCACEYVKGKLVQGMIRKELEKLRSKKVFTEHEFDTIILKESPLSKYGKYTVRYIKEACAIAAYRKNLLGPSVQTLVCDDAPQFKVITEYLQLCWVHEIRHYKKLDPFINKHRIILNDFMELFYCYYDALKKFKLHPSAQSKKNLCRQFDKLFVPDKKFYALNALIRKTLKKKESLLLVLEFPEIPLHNNACELDVREKVMQRKIRNCHRSLEGAKNSDIFLALMATCRKNGISFWNYITDRIYCLSNILPLYKIIEQNIHLDPEY